MWGLSDVKLRISIKIRDESIWHSASLSLCLAGASIRAGMSSLRPCLLCGQRGQCRCSKGLTTDQILGFKLISYGTCNVGKACHDCLFHREVGAPVLCRFLKNFLYFCKFKFLKSTLI